MTHKKDRPSIVRHVSFTQEEDHEIRRAAEKAGMRVCPYIREKSLSGNVSEIDWDALREHTEAINCIADEILTYVREKNPNRWLYGLQISFFEKIIDDVKRMEAELIEIIFKGRKDS